MANEVLNSLLKEYEKKKLLTEQIAEKRKEDLYNKVPKLKEIDEIAYVRFASVYRQFKDINEFKEELNKLLR